jgi:ACR3 family arsenite transporter
VAPCIPAGVALVGAAPGPFGAMAAMEYGSVNFVVAVPIWFMVYPMMAAVDLAALSGIHERPKGLGITRTVKRLVKPFTSAARGVRFFPRLFAGLMDAAQAGRRIAGLILLGAAASTAMVFVRSRLPRGDAALTLARVAADDLITVFAFAPNVAFLPGVTDLSVPWEAQPLPVVPMS